MLSASIIVLGYAAASMLLGWLYFHRYHIIRPIGVINLVDIRIMVAGVILVPYLYLRLPLWIVACLLLVGSISILYFAWEPVLQARGAIWFTALLLAVGDIVVSSTKAGSVSFFAVNNFVLTLCIVGIANLWVQSGMKGRDAAILGLALALYDFIATSQLTVTDDLFGRMAGLPFAPLIAWPIEAEGSWLGVGLGDVLLATAFPLVMRKTFGIPAGLVAAGVSLVMLAGLLLSTAANLLIETFPVMIALGPQMVAQFSYWRLQQKFILPKVAINSLTENS